MNSMKSLYHNLTMQICHLEIIRFKQIYTLCSFNLLSSVVSVVYHVCSPTDLVTSIGAAWEAAMFQCLKVLSAKRWSANDVTLSSHNQIYALPMSNNHDHMHPILPNYLCKFTSNRTLWHPKGIKGFISTGDKKSLQKISHEMASWCM